jgi:predicted nucleotidyltransferase component of viral defense system
MKYGLDYINDISRRTGFGAANLEKALRLKEVLREFARHPFLEGRLVLKGGTAVNLFLFGLPRLSVDIDLNYVGHLEREEMLKERPLVEQAVEQVCRGLGYQVQRGANDYALLGYYLGFTNHADRNDRIQVEINFLMRVCALPPAELKAGRLADEPTCRYPLLAVEELMSGKLKAMIERSHPRDLYDLYRFQQSRRQHDAELLRKLTVVFVSTVDRDVRDYRLEQYS